MSRLTRHLRELELQAALDIAHDRLAHGINGEADLKSARQEFMRAALTMRKFKCLTAAPWMFQMVGN